MEQLFAPWRIEWVTREDRTSDGCVFCTLPDDETDVDHLIVARSEHAYVLLNNYPYNPGHVMVIPYHHTGEYQTLDSTVVTNHARLTQQTLDAMEAAISPDGFNTGMNLGTGAGGSIDAHLHTHIVPRWQEDTNFMAVISDTKLIVQALEDTYQQLHEAFLSLPASTGNSDSGAVRLELS